MFYTAVSKWESTGWGWSTLWVFHPDCLPWAHVLEADRAVGFVHREHSGQADVQGDVAGVFYTDLGVEGLWNP